MLLYYKFCSISSFVIPTETSSATIKATGCLRLSLLFLLFFLFLLPCLLSYQYPNALSWAKHRGVRTVIPLRKSKWDQDRRELKLINIRTGWVRMTESSPEEKNLGVLIDKKLKMTQQCVFTAQKTALSWDAPWEMWPAGWGKGFSLSAVLLRGPTGVQFRDPQH